MKGKWRLIKLANEIFKEEIMSDEQLDNVVGGATGYIYYRRNTVDGKRGYSAVKVSGRLKKSEVTDAYNRSVPMDIHDLRDGVDGKFFVRDKDVEMVRNNMQARGYKFINYDDM